MNTVDRNEFAHLSREVLIEMLISEIELNRQLQAGDDYICSMEYGVKDIFIIPYSSKWGWKYENSVVQKLYPDLETCLHYCRQLAKKENADIYVEVKGKWVKQKK